MEIRPLERWEEYRACEELQRVIWGEDFGETAPAGLMKVARRVGGVATGAFDETGRMVGFVFGVTGRRDGRPVHWSHMLGVRPGHQGRGLGLRLKERQREELLERGVAEARWSFDPLVSRNAHFNLNRLGARVLEYVTDMYGESESDLHRGIGTDRFVVAWDLEAYDPSVAEPSAGPAAAPRQPAPEREASIAGAGSEPGAGPDPTGPLERGPGPGPLPAGAEEAGAPEDAEGDPSAAPPVVRVEIPADILEVRDGDPEAAEGWRERTRGALLPRLEAGYRVQGYVPGPERGFYVLVHPEVRAAEVGEDG